MKVMKKLIAAISTLAMAATMFSAVLVHAAVDEPIVKLRLDEVSSGVYNLAVNVDSTNCELGNKVNMFQFAIGLDADKFDMENGPLLQEYDEDSEEDVYVNIEYGKTKFATGAFSYRNNRFTYIFSDSTGKGQAMSTPTDLITLKNLKLKDGVTTDDITIEFLDLLCEVGNGSIDMKSYGVAAQLPKVVMSAENIGSVVFPGNKVVDPTPVGPVIQSVGTFTANNGDEVTLPNQRAVASIATAAGEEGVTGFKWTIEVTGGNNAGTYSKPFDVANLEVTSEMKFGLIVEYDTTQADSVAITGVELVK